jgi:hypothetical protein
VTSNIRSRLATVLHARTGLSGAIMKSCPFTDRGDTLWSYVNFARAMNRWPDLQAVPGFNDGLLRVKLAERDDALRHQVADKLRFKAFACERLTQDHVVPLLGVIGDKASLRTYRFPDNCMIKPTDASGVGEARRDAEPLDMKLLGTFFHRNHYRFTREKFYKHIPPGIIVEELVTGDGGLPPLDYKVFCFFGRAKIIQWMDRNGENGPVKRWYTPQWRPLGFTLKRELAPIVPRPPFLADLIAAAETLGEGFSAVRADFLSNGTRLLAGELTNVDGNAVSQLKPDPAPELKLGRLFTDPHVSVDDLID